MYKLSPLGATKSSVPTAHDRLNSHSFGITPTYILIVLVDQYCIYNFIIQVFIARSCNFIQFFPKEIRREFVNTFMNDELAENRQQPTAAFQQVLLGNLQKNM